jgi:hypothetical protein
VAAPGQPLGIEAGGPVERFGHRSAPVHHQRLVVGARDGQASDVEGLAQQRSVLVVPFGEAIDTAEVERLVTDVELLQPGQAGPHHNVAFGPRLERAPLAQIQDPLEHVPRFGPHALEAIVGAVEKLLLSL